MSVGDIARELGLSYSSAYWHVGQLVKKGLLRTVEVDGRRLVALADGASSVRDALLQLEVALIGRGISPDDDLRTALSKLGAIRSASC
ncbi:MAG: helix-turn-helix transcriptional regulator [Thermoproteus sp.]|nr:helix-turn-helix transcriptional regulator [Thermoproteus sp.]